MISSLINHQNFVGFSQVYRPILKILDTLDYQDRVGGLFEEDKTEKKRKRKRKKEKKKEKESQGKRRFFL